MTVTTRCPRSECGGRQRTNARTTVKCVYCGHGYNVAKNITNLPPGNSPVLTLRGRIR